MLENVIKKLFPIRDEKGRPCTFPTFASQVFGDGGEKRALWQEGKGFCADNAANAENAAVADEARNAEKLGGKNAEEYLLSDDALKMELLWENVVFSSFAEQTIGLTLDGYDDIVIVFSQTESDGTTHDFAPPFLINRERNGILHRCYAKHFLFRS